MTGIPAELINRARAVPLEEVLAARGIVLGGRGLDRSGPCPRPGCGGMDNFSFHLGKQVFNCRGCGASGGGAIDLMMFLDGVALPKAVRTLVGARSPYQQRRSQPIARPPVTTARADDDAVAQRRKAAWLWSQRRPSDPVLERYLRQARGYQGPIPPTLGFLPAHGTYPPAMIAAYSLPTEPEPGRLALPREIAAVHLTRLLPDGSDREHDDRAKITIAKPRAHPIVIAPPNDLCAIAITEGIEDALSVYQATGLGSWAAGSAPFMPLLAGTVPEYIETVTLYAHDDGGRRFALRLADALTARGIEIYIEGLCVEN